MLVEPKKGKSTADDQPREEKVQLNRRSSNPTSIMSHSKNRVYHDYKGDYRGHTYSRLVRVHCQLVWGNSSIQYDSYHLRTTDGLCDRNPTALEVQSLRIQAHRYKKIIRTPNTPLGLGGAFSQS